MPASARGLTGDLFGTYHGNALYDIEEKRKIPFKDLLRGDSGSGEQGPAGPQGEVGPAGPSGPVGPTGPAGPQGIQGALGPTGPVGPQGPQGEIGTTGATGPAGPKGDKGDKGDIGPVGLRWMGEWDPEITYESNDVVSFWDEVYFCIEGNTTLDPHMASDLWAKLTIQGNKGDQGEQGATGPTGPAGPQGIQGAIGATGETGPAGPQGEIGAQGPAGPQGPAGSQGPQGPEGPSGPTGPAGPQGVQGVAGSDGAIGPEGPQGEKGEPGENKIHTYWSRVPFDMTQRVRIKIPGSTLEVIIEGSYGGDFGNEYQFGLKSLSTNSVNIWYNITSNMRPGLPDFGTVRIGGTQTFMTEYFHNADKLTQPRFFVCVIDENIAVAVSTFAQGPGKQISSESSPIFIKLEIIRTPDTEFIPLNA